uniref:Uncharacterized protein n=1 Tax=Lutzomyia longipalpis TaxID=7200 RepID=A0A1B0CJL4_LUTLO
MNPYKFIEELSSAGTDSLQLQCIVNRYITSDFIRNITKTEFSRNDRDNDLSEMIAKIISQDQNILFFTINHPTIKCDSNANQVALLVCIVTEEEIIKKREIYEKSISEVFTYILGHLLTSFELFEEKRVRGQCQNLLQVARRLLGKVGMYKGPLIHLKKIKFSIAQNNSG